MQQVPNRTRKGHRNHQQRRRQVEVSKSRYRGQTSCQKKWWKNYRQQNQPRYYGKGLLYRQTRRQ